MRFVWAVVSFLVAAVLVAAGIAQRTIFLGPTTAQASLAAPADESYVLVDSAAFQHLPSSQTLTVTGDGDVFMAYVRTADAEAWLADRAYARAGVNDEGVVTMRSIKPSIDAVELSEQAEKSAQAAAKAEIEYPTPQSPIGSDLWIDSFVEPDTIVKPLAMKSEDGISILIASDGTQPAPASIELSWQIDNSTPWVGPLIVLGGIAIAIGVLFWVLGFRHMRRSRGPRRRGLPPLPESQANAEIEPGEASGELESADDGTSESEPAGADDARAGAETATADDAAAGDAEASGGADVDKRTAGRSERRVSRRLLTALPVLGLSAAAMTGCTADAWPDFGGADPEPTPTSTVVAPDHQQTPVLTEQQAQAVFDRIAKTAAVADEKKSPNLAAARLSGAVLAERRTNYTLRDKIKKEPTPLAVPEGPYEIVLPEAREGWPRTVMALWSDPDDAKTPPQILFAEQTDPWSPYRLSYYGQMEAAASVPDLAPASFGASIVRPDSNLLLIAPEQLAATYADVLDKGEKSDYAELFDLDGDAFRKKIVTDRKDRLKEFNKEGKETGSLKFGTEPGEFDPVALSTVRSGAIVAVSLTETDTVKATDDDAVIKLEGNKRVAALTGKDETPKGITTSYSDQLFFYVPGQDADEKITLLGYSTNILDAKELK